MNLLAYFGHLFLPGYSNDQKAKLIHSSSIFSIVVLLIFAQILMQLTPSVGLAVLGYASQISIDDVVKLTNQKRSDAGAGELTVNPELTAAAKAKGEHMLQNDYWAHVAPDGTQPWKFFVDYGYKYKYAGENLAKDFSSATSAVDAWMASPSHKENLLSTKYDEIGIAVVEGDLNGSDTTIIVQLFGKRLSGASATEASPVAAKIDENNQAEPNLSISPNATPTESVINPTETPVFIAAGVQDKVSGSSKTFISPFTTTKGITILASGLLMVVFVIDSVVVAKKRLSRFGGRVFAHLAFLGMILTLVIISKVGDIL